MEEEDDKQLLIAVCVILGVPLLAALIWYTVKQCKLRRQQRVEGPLLQETAQTGVDQKQGAPASQDTARSEDMPPAAAMSTRDLEAQLPAQLSATTAPQPRPSAGTSSSAHPRAHASRQQHHVARYMDRHSGRSGARMHPSAPMQHGARAPRPGSSTSAQAADRGTQPSSIEFSDLSGAEKGANQAIARGGGEPRTRVPIAAPVAPRSIAGDGNGSEDKAFTVALVQPDGQRVVLPAKNDSAKPGPLDARFLVQPQVPLPVMSPGAERDAKLREQAHRIDELEQRVDSLLAAGAVGQTAGKQIDPPPPAETREMPEQLLSSPQLEV